MGMTETAIGKFKNGSGCSQAILSTFSSLVGLDEKTAHKLGTGFGSGFGRKQYTCGAITGAVAILSLKYGNEMPGNPSVKEKTYEIVFNFIDEVEKRLGGSSCRELLGYRIRTKEDMKIAKERNLFNDICSKCISTVADLLEETISQKA